VPVNEQIVGRLGRLVGAAVCDVGLVEIPKELSSWSYRPGHRLAAGYAHASRALDDVLETRQVRHLHEDDNGNRITTLSILADWCWASDQQWLYATKEENRYYSHDHGHYFPGGPGWTIASLKNQPTTTCVTGMALTHRGSADAVVARLEALGSVAIAEAISALPATWPVSNYELAELITFLNARRLAVISRMKVFWDRKGAT